MKKYADFRSDTTTQPTQEMREAVLTAQVGDDLFDDDPTTKELEALAAKMAGKEAALYVSSGTMGNQLALLASTNPGDEVICNEYCHIMDNEAGGGAFLSGVQLRSVFNEDYTVHAEDIKRMYRVPGNIHKPISTLLCMEQATAAGNVIPLDIMKESYETAKELGLKVHLDGARLFNAATTLKVDIKEILQYTDSAMFCLSKGLCAPLGSMLVGSKEFIAEAKRYRKILGGGLRQNGFAACAGIVALTKMVDRLQEDHDNAKYLAVELNKIDGVVCDPEMTQINMVFAQITDEKLNGSKFVEDCFKKDIKIVEPEADGHIRFVTNNDVTRENCDQLLAILKAQLV